MDNLPWWAWVLIVIFIFTCVFLFIRNVDKFKKNNKMPVKTASSETSYISYDDWITNS